MSLRQITRKLRCDQTDEEKELWRALRGRRFAGFKFRRQHVTGEYILDFYCADAKLAVELDGFQHGLPKGIQRDEAREKFLVDQDIETLRFWNHQWRKNPDGCLLEIWNALQRRTGCVQIMTNAEKQTFVPPDLKKIQMREKTNPSPWPSPHLSGERETEAHTSWKLPEYFSTVSCKFKFSEKNHPTAGEMLREELKRL